jgi:hypothetical protein
MSESTIPKLVLLDLKGQKIIHILNPTIRTTRQARKYRKKTKTTKPTNTKATIGARRGGGCLWCEQKWR